MNAVDLNLNDVQGNIVPGFRSDYEDFLFVRFTSAQAGRDWLRRLYEEVSSAQDVAAFALLRQSLRHPPKITGAQYGDTLPQRQDRDVHRFVQTIWINVALTAVGLSVIGWDPRSDDKPFPVAFTDGMAGDRGEDADRDDVKATWHLRDKAGPGDERGERVAHAVLILGADTEADLDAEQARQIQRLTATGLILIACYRGQTLGGGREHFGFRDGISQPDPEPAPLLSGWQNVNSVTRPGEFILGQPDEQASTAFKGPDWARNGSYLVFRRLRQHVSMFNQAMRSQSEILTDFVNPMDEDILGAKLVGRWPSGASLFPGDSRETPPSADPFHGTNAPDDRLPITPEDFKGDQYGDICPMVSHIRRAYPRDSETLEPQRHRIIRRGIPYGPPVTGDGADNADRGLLFVAYQADIERGFEKIQHAWFNSGETPAASELMGQSNGWDPLVGIVNEDLADSAITPRGLNYHISGGDPSQHKLISLDQFVEVTGGGYFFAPAVGAIALLGLLGSGE